MTKESVVVEEVGEGSDLFESFDFNVDKGTFKSPLARELGVSAMEARMFLALGCFGELEELLR